MGNSLDDQQHAGEKLLIVLIFSLMISVMNLTMFNVAIPNIITDYNLLPSQVSWIVTGYMIVYAVGSVTYGKLADKYRLKDLLTFGLAFFAVGSVVGLLATEYWMIIAGRILQAMGSSVVPTTAMLIPIRYFPLEKRGRALGTSAIGLAVGSALGPIIGGFVTGAFGWRFLFFLPLLSLLTIPFFRRYLDDAKGKDQKTDLIGGALLAGAVALILLSITRGSWILTIFGAVLLILLLVRIRFAVEPFIQPSLFKNKNYSFGLVIAFMTTSFNSALPFIMPQMLSELNHLSPIAIGFIMLPGAVATAFMGRQAGKLADKKGNATVVYLASILLFISFSLLSIFAGISPFIIILFLVLGNVGQIFMMLAMSNTISQTLSKEQAGIGMGIFTLVNFFSGAVMTVITGKALDFGSTVFQLNPLLFHRSALVYSNIFLGFTILLVVIALLYYLKFVGSSTRNIKKTF